MSDKDVFKMMLDGGIPCFGYITSKERRNFVTFLQKHGFINFDKYVADLTKRPVDVRRIQWEKYNEIFRSLKPFRFHHLEGYREVERHIRDHCTLVTDKSSRLIDLGNRNIDK